MKKNTPIIIVFLSLCILTTLGALWLSAPNKLETKLNQTIHSAGFENATLPPAQKKLGQTLYQNIALDPDGFSTLKTLTINYNPLKFALLGKIESLRLSSLDLTGELDPQGQITIAGWNDVQSSLSQTLKLKNTLIEIENARLSVLSQKWGGTSLNLDMQARPQGQHVNLQGKITATQRKLSATANLEGQITNEDFWDLRMELEQGKFTLPNLQASRLAGLINLSSQNMLPIRILGELEAGGLKIAELPWQKGALTLEGTVHEPQMILAAKSTGIEGLELAFDIPNIRTPSLFSGTLHTDKLANLFDYLEEQNKLPVPRDTLTFLDQLNNIDIIFANQKNLIFNIKNEEQEIDIKGNLIIKEEEGYTGEIQAALLPLSSLTSAPDALGTVNMQGNFTTTANKISGTLQFQLAEDSILPYGPIPLTLSGAKIKLRDWRTLSGPLEKSLPCAIRNFKPKHNCSLSLQIRKSQITPSALTIKTLGTKIDAPSDQDKNKKTLLKINEIDLKDLFQALKKSNWNAAGYLEGTAALYKENGKLIIDNLYLKNKGIGILKLKDDTLFDLMEMKDFEKETMKLALENFHYDLLEIKASGALPDDVHISVFGKGKNPYLLQGRSFSLDFKIKPNFAPLIETLFPATKTD
ncbi:MAG: YdbH domain-containing protein [Rhodospirillales bacterium]|nr:YdbH domain-containing protein [Alphaproteobacteria bacterium]MCB9980813.1 YdbH domain-containing protein [Rhodospirillales bacterium]